MSVHRYLSALLIVGCCAPLTAQDTLMLAMDEFHILREEAEDQHLMLNIYDRFNPLLGADSTRTCDGQPCSGWVKDIYGDGTLKHRGYYDQGRLLLYKNYHKDGTLEREFRSIDVRRSIMRTYHPNSILRSETRYIAGVAVEYHDHYVNGQLRYHEQKHRTEPYYLRMDLYAANGDPISLFKLVDRKKLEFEIKEYHPGGKVYSTGRARYDPYSRNTRRTGRWAIYDREGGLQKIEEYVDGKALVVR